MLLIGRLLAICNGRPPPGSRSANWLMDRNGYEQAQYDRSLLIKINWSFDRLINGFCIGAEEDL